MIVFLCLCVRGDYSGIVILCVCVGSFYFPPLALKPFLGQAADSSLDSYLDFCSITERCLFCFISLLIPSASSLLVFLWNHFMYFLTVLLRFSKRPVEVLIFSFSFIFPLFRDTLITSSINWHHIHEFGVSAYACVQRRQWSSSATSALRQAVEHAGWIVVLLRERPAAVPDRLGMEGQMAFD